MPRRPHSSGQARLLYHALLERPADWRHGYDLLQVTGLKSGTLYPLLMRLADDGLLEAEWSEPVPPARAPRHVYRLTNKGHAFATALLAEAGGRIAAQAQLA
ncbi:MAG TPA: PadR family transcriptional regulator [Croceibacterium sp.]